MAKSKVEMFASKSQMRRHEKMEMPSKVASEKKSGEKDKVVKASKISKKSKIKVSK